MLVSLTLGPKPFDIRMDWEDYHDHSTLNEFIGDAFFHMEISLIISDLIVSRLCLMIPCFRVVDAFSPHGKQFDHLCDYLIVVSRLCLMIP